LPWAPFDKKFDTTISIPPGDTLLLISAGESPSSAGEKRLLVAVRASIVDSRSARLENLERIIMPKVEFRDTPLGDAITFLRVESVQLDPDQKGINVILQSGSDAAELPRVTLLLKEIPVKDALRRVADLAGFKIRCRSCAVVIFRE